MTKLKDHDEVEDLDEAAAERELAETAADGDGEAPSASEVPDWACVPPNVKMPKPGVTVAFVRIPAKWTTDPGRGDRWCCCWMLGETDERLALQRARGDQVRSVSELAKATVRIVDGHKADWSGIGKPGSVQDFWSGIGPKGRQIVRNYYVRTHAVTDEESLDFFSNHFAVVTVG